MGRDREPSARVFTSQLERDQWQITEYGNVRNAFRAEIEPADGRPWKLVMIEPFWSDYTEQLAYEAAVEEHPPGRIPEADAPHYLERIVRLVQGRYERAGKPFPRPMTRREREAQLAQLRAQAQRMPYRDDAA